MSNNLNAVQRGLQEREAEALLAARWSYTDVVAKLMETHSIAERTAKRRVAAVYEKLARRDDDDRKRALNLARESTRREVMRLRGEIARLDAEEQRVLRGEPGRRLAELAKIRERISRTMLGWEKYLLELQGVRRNHIELLYESDLDPDDLPLSRDEAIDELAGDLTDEEFDRIASARKPR